MADAIERREVFDRYASAFRGARIPGYRTEELPDLTRHFPIDGNSDEVLLSFARFERGQEDRRIVEELGRLEREGMAAEWKLHDFDAPADLKPRLEARGLTCHHVEALMVLEARQVDVRPEKHGNISIEAASGPALDEIAAFQEQVWKCRLPWLAGALRGRIDPIYCARANGRVVGSGWIDFHEGAEFATIHGGSVAEDYRGRGIYSRLFERRVVDAQARGTPFIAVDAAPMSRPILEKRGFRFICHTHPMRTRPFDTSPVTRG